METTQHPKDESPDKRPKPDLNTTAAKEVLAIKSNGRLYDVSANLTPELQSEPITRDHPEALGLIRHSCAHVMAEAVQSLFPDIQVTIGPAIDDGFYYDFACSEPLTIEDLPKIEQKMHQIIAANQPFSREVWQRHQARDYFIERGEYYKAQIIDDLPQNEEITLYRQGHWLDLCRGPHIRSTGQIGQAFKLMKLAGAYWRGDSRNAMLQRIYGTAWRDDKELQTYLYQIEEAKRRDHRVIGKQMSLFHFQEEAAGSTFWHAKGWTLWRIVEAYIRTQLTRQNYIEVKTPQLIKRSLWETSGHWETFHQNMFTVNTEEDKVLALKPMNCPGHVQIFRQGLKSYRDLPLRMAEFGSCHRQEPSGSLHGLMRVRSFTQDDAHIFCTEAQICEESVAFCRLLESVYHDFGFTELMVKFSDRPLPRAGSDEVWDRAEEALRTAVQAAELDYSLNPGEGAFYGPKLEFILRDAIGREWQCGTLQVDFVLPERLDASYIDHTSHSQRPVMLHRAILGSLERFIGILIEHYAGKFPFWLAPLQGVIATITHHANSYGAMVYARLCDAHLRVQLDTRNEKINFKIREHSMQKIPLLIIIGKREAEQQTLVLRWNDGQQETLVLEEAVTKLLHQATSPIGRLHI